MKLFLLLVTLLIVASRNLLPLLKQKIKKDIYVFAGLMAIAAYLSISTALGLYVPNPSKGLQTIFQPVNQLIQQLLNKL